jgi:hypothetical protein
VKFAQHATVLVDYFLRDMKVDDPTRKEEDLLDALQGAIDQKRRQLQTKRGYAMVDQANPDELTASQTITDTPTPSPLKRRATSEFSEQSQSNTETRSVRPKGSRPEIPGAHTSSQADVGPTTGAGMLFFQQTFNNEDYYDYNFGGLLTEIMGCPQPPGWSIQ